MMKVTTAEPFLHELVFLQREGGGHYPGRLQRNGLEESQEVVAIICNGVCLLTLCDLSVFLLVNIIPVFY